MEATQTHTSKSQARSGNDSGFMEPQVCFAQEGKKGRGDRPPKLDSGRSKFLASLVSIPNFKPASRQSGASCPIAYDSDNRGKVHDYPIIVNQQLKLLFSCA
jgi:hypothetical protein